MHEHVVLYGGSIHECTVAKIMLKQCVVWHMAWDGELNYRD